MSNRRAAAALAALTLCTAATPAPTAPPRAAATARASKPTPQASSPTEAPVQGSYGVWIFHMTDIHFNTHTGYFETPAKVSITRPGGDVTADRATGNRNTGKMTLYGDVVVHDLQGAFDSSSGKKNAAPATLTCDQLQIDDKAKIYVATGHVHYVQGDAVSDSDRGTLDDATHVLTLDGHVHLVKGQQKLWADHATYNTATGDGEAKGKDAVMEMPAGPMGTLTTPKPLTPLLKNPFSHKKAAASPSPGGER